MTTKARQVESEELGAAAALEELFRPFAGGWTAQELTLVHPDAIPHPQDDLLVHHEHMTVMLEKHHGSPVAVKVYEEHRDGDIYTRKIALSPTPSGSVVEWGICRLNFRHISPKVRDEILAKVSPLGAVLIKHKVHRRVKPRYFLRLPAHSEILKMFGAPDNAEPVYGRIGTIYCDNEPAIELLEIVVNCRE
jgi:hypothetical protein